MATIATLKKPSGALRATRMARGLAALRTSVAGEMAAFESDLERLRRNAPSIQKPAHHVLGLAGKRLRPLCVVLAARLGTGTGRPARDLALAVELIHDASLLHDDVIDVGERRRGAPAARVLFGNAASIIAGNWLLTAALKRVLRSGLPGVLDRALGTIEEMVDAEAVQLRNRGRVNIARQDYFRVVDGKTASLFRLALWGGGQAGGLSESRCLALERFGTHLGVAFQLMDDLLDFSGDAGRMGKPVFNDLREGKMTYPLLVALERDAKLRPYLEEIARTPDGAPLTESIRVRVLGLLHSTGGLRECRARARTEAQAAAAELRAFPDAPELAPLAAVAAAIVEREG